MKVFCDTNLLVAAFCESHPHYSAARPIVERVIAGKDEGFVSAHSLAEVYSVMTRLPGGNQAAPATAWQLLSANVMEHFTVIHLTGKEYAETLKEAAAPGVQGGIDLRRNPRCRRR